MGYFLKQERNKMVRSYILRLALLFVCAAPLHGMMPGDEREGQENWKLLGASGAHMLTGGFAEPTAQAMAMTTVAALPQGMMYLTSEKVLSHALTMGTLTGWVGLFITFCLWGLGHTLGVNPRNYPHHSVSQWTKPATIVPAVVLTCFMLAMGREVLVHNAGSI